MTGGARHFLFLQGPASTLFFKTGRNLCERGHRVTRVNLCAGDRIFWRGRLARNYRGDLASWPAYVEQLLGQGVTDLVMMGEERPHHRVAADLAARHGATVTIVEMGYLRPDWITLERGGISTNSHFPNNPGTILRAAHALPEPDFARRFDQSFLAEVLCDLAWNLPTVFLGFLHPHYRPHAIDHPLAEYAGWLRRFARGGKDRRMADATIAALTRTDAPFFVYPLQLETDYQLRAHSPFSSQSEAIGQIVEAFAEGAPDDCRLVVKSHPLDNGLRDWRAMCLEAADRHGIASRIDYIDGGDLAALLGKARGAVMINSTVGLQALMAGLPVKTLGTSVYDIEGLTSAQPLPAFFADPCPPDARLCAALVRLLAAAIHVRGNFCSTKGTDAGAAAIAERLDAQTVNLPGAFVDPPPRRARS